MTTTAQRTDRWELVRAVGAAITTPPPHNTAVRRALGLPDESRADHTEAFVLGLPPFAAIYLGPEGQLGGDGQDRVGGFWRALGLDAPGDADHLGALLLLYAALGEAATSALQQRRVQLERARTALLSEHILSWAPTYLAALERLDCAAATAWVNLTRRVLAEEAQTTAEAALPAALRDAPAPFDAADRNALLDGVLAPVCSGIVLSQRDLRVAAGRVGAGFRRGERRFALRALLDQDARGTIGWLRNTAEQWAQTHRDSFDAGSHAARWWESRACATAAALTAQLDGP